MRVFSSLPLTVLLATQCAFVMLGLRTAFSVLYPAMVAAEGWTVSEVSSAYAASVVVYGLAAPVVGLLVDRFGVRPTMLSGSLLMLAGHVLLGRTEQVWQLYVAYALINGVGGAAIGFVSIVKMISLRAGSRFGRAMGIANLGLGAGALITSPLVQVAVEQWGWREATGAWGAAAFVLVAPLALIVAPGRAGLPGRREVAEAGPVLWGSPVFWLVICANVGLGYFMLVPTHQVAHLQVAGFDPLPAATIGGLMGGLMGVGAVIGGWFADRVGPVRMSLGAAGLMSLGVLSLMAAGPHAPLLAWAWVLGGGLGRGGGGVTMVVVQSRIFAGPRLGRVTGVLEIAFGLGAAAGPWVGALSRDLGGSYVPGLASALLAGLLACGGTIAAWRRYQAANPLPSQSPATLPRR